MASPPKPRPPLRPGTLVPPGGRLCAVHSGSGERAYLFQSVESGRVDDRPTVSLVLEDAVVRQLEVQRTPSPEH